MSVYCGDGEPVAYYRETLRTARKQHECCACEIPIQPGNRYWVIAACYDNTVRGWKRCERCQFIHQQLRPLCQAKDEWPDEELNCGHTFEEAHDREPPEFLAALAFWRPGDPLPHVEPCTPSLRWDRERAITYDVHHWRHDAQRCQPQASAYWGIEGPRGPDPAHITPCTLEAC